MEQDLSIFTQAVLAAHDPPQKGGSPAVPAIVPSVGFVHPTMHDTDRALGDDSAGHIYGRYGGPTQMLFEEAVATLEGAEAAVSFSSGMAALHAAILSLVPPGGVIVAAEQVYGATRTLLEWMSGSMGINVHYADFLNHEAIAQIITSARPTAVICEVLTNPLVRVVPLDFVIETARQVDAGVLVDNTFATPFLLKPLELGAALVVHSATKFLNGHGDVLGGVIAGSEDVIRVARGHRKLLGATPGSFESWLALRGLRTLALRMKQSCLSARQVAAWMESQPGIRRVFYPGLASDEGTYEVARTLFRRNHYGGILALELDTDSRDAVFAFVERLRVIQPVTSLGDVNSLISHPATSSHRNLAADERAALGIFEGTLRISVGIEDPNDLIADLARALSVP